jgi:hypothetical protein
MRANSNYEDDGFKPSNIGHNNKCKWLKDSKMGNEELFEYSVCFFFSILIVIESTILAILIVQLSSFTFMFCATSLQKFFILKPESGKDWWWRLPHLHPLNNFCSFLLLFLPPGPGNHHSLF